ncbi:MAG TPA: HlyD family efflux transporter periplasmic adaptor subunit [Terriglobales bacterium]|jgi:multidrug efflux pump subunit AcrA (membrane-fusion protein)|nr:HlyD family efflux transporter periplasmic adaptor subunit [Terriglobales bacterium]
MNSSLSELGLQPGAPTQEDKPPSHQTPPRGKRKIGIAIAVLVVTIFIGLALFRRSSAPVTGILPKSVNAAVQGLRLKGTTEAVQMRVMLAPTLSGQFVATLTITRLVTSGSAVKKGEVLVEFDRQSQMREFIDRKADYDKLVSQVIQEQSKESAGRAKDETEIKQAEDALSKAELEMQKVEIVSRIDAEKARETLEEAKATLQQLRETFDLKRKAAQAGIRILEIQRDRTHEIMMHAQADADLLQIRSPLDGVAVLNTIWKQGRMGEVQEGDQLRPGTPFMQVVDPSLMQVRVSANQQDFVKLRVGQSAQIHLDAYPELVFPGRLEEMAPIARGGDFSSKLRYFPVVFSVTGHDAKLMPDLSAAVDVTPTEGKP